MADIFKIKIEFKPQITIGDVHGNVGLLLFLLIFIFFIFIVLAIVLIIIILL